MKDAEKKRGEGGSWMDVAKDAGAGLLRAGAHLAGEVPYARDTSMLTSGSPSQIAGNFLGSFVPTGVADLAKATDSTRREQVGLTGPTMARIPGLRQQLPTKQDALGRDVPEHGGLGPLAPSRYTELRTDPLTQAIQKYDLRVPLAGYQVSLDGEMTHLTHDEHRLYTEFLGDEIGKRVNGILSDPAVTQGRTDAQVHDIIQRSLDDMSAYGPRKAAVGRLKQHMRTSRGPRTKSLAHGRRK